MIKLSEVFPNASPRQREVCAMLIQGFENKEIARYLGISHRTVEDHRREMFRRAGVKNTSGLLYKVVGSPEVLA